MASPSPSSFMNHFAAYTMFPDRNTVSAASAIDSIRNNAYSPSKSFNKDTPRGLTALKLSTLIELNILKDVADNEEIKKVINSVFEKRLQDLKRRLVELEAAGTGDPGETQLTITRLTTENKLLKNQIAGVEALLGKADTMVDEFRGENDSLVEGAVVMGEQIEDLRQTIETLKAAKAKAPAKAPAKPATEPEPGTGTTTTTTTTPTETTTTTSISTTTTTGPEEGAPGAIAGIDTPEEWIQKIEKLVKKGESIPAIKNFYKSDPFDVLILGTLKPSGFVRHPAMLDLVNMSIKRYLILIDMKLPDPGSGKLAITKANKDLNIAYRAIYFAKSTSGADLWKSNRKMSKIIRALLQIDYIIHRGILLGHKEFDTSLYDKSVANANIAQMDLSYGVMIRWFEQTGLEKFVEEGTLGEEKATELIPPVEIIGSRIIDSAANEI